MGDTSAAPQEMSLQDLGRAAAITLAAEAQQQQQHAVESPATAPPPQPSAAPAAPQGSSVPAPDALRLPPLRFVHPQLSTLQEAAAACLAEGTAAGDTHAAAGQRRRAPAAAPAAAAPEGTPAKPPRKRATRRREEEVVVIDPSSFPPALQQSLCFTATAPGGQPLFFVDQFGCPVQLTRPPVAVAPASAAPPVQAPAVAPVVAAAAPQPQQPQVLAQPWVGVPAAPVPVVTAVPVAGAAAQGTPVAAAAAAAASGTNPLFMTPFGTISLEQVEPVRRNTRGRSTAAPKPVVPPRRRYEEETVADLGDGRKIVRAKKHERSRNAVFRGRIMTLFKMASEIETITSAKYLMVIVDKENGDVFLRSSKELRNVLQESGAINDVVAVSREMRERSAQLHAADPNAKMEPTHFHRAQHQQNQRPAPDSTVQMPISPRAAGLKKNKRRSSGSDSAAAAAAAAADKEDEAAAAEAAAEASESDTEPGSEHDDDGDDDGGDDDDDGEKTDDEVQPMDLSAFELPHDDKDGSGVAGSTAQAVQTRVPVVPDMPTAPSTSGSSETH